MVLKTDGTIEFTSCKELANYIRCFSHIECNRDTSILSSVVEDCSALTELIVRDGDGCISVEEGEFDDAALDNVIEMGGTDGLIVLKVNIAGLTFVKSHCAGEWKAEDPECLRSLPLGFTKEEQEECMPCDFDEACEYISEMLDVAVGVDKCFGYDYRTFRSVEDDIIAIESQLGELGYDGFYAEKIRFEWPKGVFHQGHKVFGWKKGSSDVDDNYVEKHLVDIHIAALYLAESCGWLALSNAESSKV